MKKIMNNPESYVDDMLDGLLKAYPYYVKAVRDDRRALVKYSAPTVGKVGIVTGGGSGHLPLFLGYVGEGLADGVAIGNVFASPNYKQILDATRAVDGGKGVLYVIGNYSGDIMNFNLAARYAEKEGIETRLAIIHDDLASAPKGSEDKRRGIAGLFYAYKLLGAKSEEGADLDELMLLCDKINNGVRTIGMALSPCQIPTASEPTFSINDSEMELGMGIHGEPGFERTKIKTSKEISEIFVNKLMEDIEINNEVSLLVNGLGATPYEELFIFYRDLYDLLVSQGINIYKSYVGEYATSMEMAGLSVTICVLDDELKQLLNKEAYSPFFKKM